jgi:CheY-like chemotaxis protein
VCYTHCVLLTTDTEQTRFIGVTVYQNPRMKELKKHSNPYAGGRWSRDDGGDSDAESAGDDGSGHASDDGSDHLADHTGSTPSSHRHAKQTLRKRTRDDDTSLLSIQLPPGAPSSQPPIVVLVVDDDAVTRMLLESFLRHFGVRSVLAKSGREALSLLLANPSLFTMAIVDCCMPDMDGFELLEQRNRTPAIVHVAFVLMTAVEGTETAERAHRLGADDYLRKPIPREILRRRIEHFAARRQWHALEKALELRVSAFPPGTATQMAP